jgi:pyruvate/2-oxoacid:ferredoxin oxidoreductase alpha subunit
MESQKTLPAAKTGQTTVLQGNEACAKAAIQAGCRFFAGYPITPPEMLSCCLSEMEKSEAYPDGRRNRIVPLLVPGGGKKAMTATSGPGLANARGQFAGNRNTICVCEHSTGRTCNWSTQFSGQQDIYCARQPWRL